MKKRRGKGVTALELMVTMAIVAVLLATAVPALKNYTWNLRLKTTMDAMQADLNLARGYAISHNVETVVCPAGGPDTCSRRSDWKVGWIVFTDLNGDRQKQTGEALLKSTAMVEFMDVYSSQSRTSLRFYPNGSSPGSNTSIIFCDQRGAQYAGKLSISNTGRIRMETGGIPPTAICP